MPFCARAGTIKPIENHPCFTCGRPLTVGLQKHCHNCDYLICLHCGNCRCTLTPIEGKTLDFVHDEYCMNLDKIKDFVHITALPWMNDNIVTNMNKALTYCREQL